MTKISKHKLSRTAYIITALVLSLLFLLVCVNSRDSFFRFYNHIDTLGQENQWVFYIYLVALCINFSLILATLTVIIIFITRKPMAIRMINKTKDIIESVYELYFLEKLKKEDSTKK